MRNLGCGDSEKIRKLLMTGLMFLLDLFWGMEGGRVLVKLHLPF